MSAPGMFNKLKESFGASWDRSNARERAMLTAGLTVVVLALIYVLLIAPAVTGRHTLEKKLPVLRQQVAELQAMSKEAVSLAGKAAMPVAPATKDSVELALARKGLKAQSVTVSGDFIKMQMNAVPFAGLLDWLDEMQRTARLSVVDVNVAALPESGMVHAALTLQQQKNAQNGE